MNRYFLFTIIVVTALFASNLFAQDATPLTSPMNLVTDTQMYYNSWASNYTKLLEAMPADKYDWVPPGITKESAGEGQTFAEWAKHGTETEQRMCSLAGTGKSILLPDLPAAKTKDQIIAQWKEATETCYPVVASLSEANLGKIVQSQYGPKPLWSTIFNLTAHNRETYGEMSIYYKMQGLKVPSTLQGDPKSWDGKVFVAK